MDVSGGSSTRLPDDTSLLLRVLKRRVLRGSKAIDKPPCLRNRDFFRDTSMVASGGSSPKLLDDYCHLLSGSKCNLLRDCKASDKPRCFQIYDFPFFPAVFRRYVYGLQSRISTKST